MTDGSEVKVARRRLREVFKKNREVFFENMKKRFIRK